VLIEISGKETEIPDGSSIEQLIRIKDAADNIVVVLNDVIIEQAQWENTALNANDRVELIQFVAGG